MPLVKAAMDLQVFCYVSLLRTAALGLLCDLS